MLSFRMKARNVAPAVSPLYLGPVYTSPTLVWRACRSNVLVLNPKGDSGEEKEGIPGRERACRADHGER
jgi:hypothetical protein